MFADTANPAFYKQFARSGISRPLSTGLIKELRDSGIDIKNGAVDLAKAARDNPGLVFGALWNAVKGLPGAVKDSFVETGHAIGEGSAVAFNDDISKKLSAIYGNDVSGYQEALLAIRTMSAVTGAAGTAKVAAAATEKIASAISKKLDDIVAAKGAEAAAETVFKTAHYASRLESAGVNVARAESAVTKEVNAMRGNLATNADTVGRLKVDIVLDC